MAWRPLSLSENLFKLASGSKAIDTHTWCGHINAVSLGIQVITGMVMCPSVSQDIFSFMHIGASSYLACWM